MPERSPMTPEVIRRQVVLEEHDVAPDGRSAVVVTRRVRAHRYVSALDVVPLAVARPIARPRQLTSGRLRDSRPRVSPDGRFVAFARSDPANPDAPSRLAIVPLGGGPVRELRPAGHGAVDELAWSPDGRRIAFTAEADPPRFLVGAVRPVDGRRRGGRARNDDEPLARRIARIDWRWDGAGHVDRWTHVFVVDVEVVRGGARPAGPARQVTRGDWGVNGLAWHPDGRTLGFVADLGADADLRPRPTVHAVDVDASDGGPRELLALGGPASGPAFSPDGRWIAAVGVLEPDPLDDLSPSVVVGPATGGGPAVDLASALDRPVGVHVDTDLIAWGVEARAGPIWLDDRALVALVTDRGRVVPYRFSFDPSTGRAGRDPEPLVEGDIVAASLAASREGELSMLATRGGRAAELTTLTMPATPAMPAAGDLRTRTRHGSAWQLRHEQPDLRGIEVAGPAGPIETWIASPRGAGDAVLPTVVNIHGGPLGAWAPAPMLETILLTARGYRVVAPNIRGSASYGRAWIRPQLGDWGGVDAADVHAAVDRVLELGLADPDRLGVLGLSYGGFMVHWLIGTSDRFRAAVSENGVANQVSAWANSDSGPEYDRTSLLGDPLSQAGVDKLWRQSPLAHVGTIRTPLLMLQGEADLRCPPSDTEQLFIALRWLRRTVEYVLYPEESHVYAVVGRPDRRIDRMTRMLDWFDRYLR